MRTKAFTLAEIMIVLTIIGILTAILAPVAINSLPNSNVLKFKKANSTLHKVINELVSSDTYYKDGDLGVKADGTTISSDQTYFCKTFADILTVKTVNCSSTTGSGGYQILNSSLGNTATSSTTLTRLKQMLDSNCASSGIGSEIVTPDDISWYQTDPSKPFGADGADGRLFPGLSGSGDTNSIDAGGIDVSYKIFCIDIDGIGSGEAPFGYGIRADGKIIAGERASLWLEKSLQDS